MIGHRHREHALLSASKAAQWIACPPSIRMAESLPEERRSEYAEEGEIAHELAEVLLRRRLLPCDSETRRKLDERLRQIENLPLYMAEMRTYIDQYVEFVEERFHAAKARSPDAVVLLEAKLDYSEWTAPNHFGTGDVVLIADGTLEVIDLKYGKGVPVSAIGNPQLRLYALGAWAEYGYLYNIQYLAMTIVQPRLDSISTDTLSLADLLEWAETVVRPAAEKAIAGKGDPKPGPHCRWCRAKAICRARADRNMAALKYELHDPRLLSIDEIGQILKIAEELADWASDVREYALEAALSGTEIPGWKVVEGRSNRTIVDPVAATERLAAAGIPAEDYLRPQELRGIGDLEKRLGKAKLASILGDLIQKPPGKPTLVPETDPRPALNSLEQEFQNWED